MPKRRNGAARVGEAHCPTCGRVLRCYHCNPKSSPWARRSARRKEILKKRKKNAN
jgi:hypothetical protein